MKRLRVLCVALVLAGCSAIPFTGEDDADDFRVPMVCWPRHTEVPCGRGIEQGVGYHFNLQTHCGVEWAYVNGRFWVPKPKVDKPSDWEGIEAGTMVLERRGVAVFEATKGGRARFVPASASYYPPTCA
jgi:hypothetical protein